MIPQKAMNTLDAMMEDYEGGDYPDQENAIQLGIEALKRVKWHKDQHEKGYYEPLPGETTE